MSTAFQVRYSHLNKDESLGMFLLIADYSSVEYG